jgi:hypothetical protein
MASIGWLSAGPPSESELAGGDAGSVSLACPEDPVVVCGGLDWGTAVEDGCVPSCATAKDCQSIANPKIAAASFANFTFQKPPHTEGEYLSFRSFSSAGETAPASSDGQLRRRQQSFSQRR